MSARAILDADVTERGLQEQLQQLMATTGWHAYHTWLSIHSTPGFPDIIATRGDRIVVAELKAERGTVSAAQQGWLDRFSAAGVETFVWRPSDWDAIVEVLR